MLFDLIKDFFLNSAKSLALKAGISSFSSACLLFYYQPEAPEAMKKYQK